MQKTVMYLCLLFFSVCVSADREKVTYVHLESGFDFPVKLGNLVREEIHHYEDKELGISVVYHKPRTNNFVLTIYVFPSPKYDDGSSASFEDHLDSEIKTIVEETEGTLQVGWPDPIPMWSDEGVPGGLAAFDWGGLHTTLSLLQLYDYGKWRVKYRTTFNIDLPSIFEDIDKAHRGFDWKKK